MERAFLVLGPEGSGNRLWMKILLAGGCLGNATYWQQFDVTLRVNAFNRPKDWKGPIAWFRSVPHRNMWADPAAMAAEVARWGWEPYFVLPVRDPTAVAGSQKGRGWDHGSPEYQLRWIWERVFTSGYGWRLVVYEALVAGGLSVANHVLSDLGLSEIDALPVELRDGNCKHFSKPPGGLDKSASK